MAKTDHNLDRLMERLFTINAKLRNFETSDGEKFQLMQEKNKILKEIKTMNTSETKKNSWTLADENGRITKIIKEPDDPLCLRVSIGGTPKTGYYLVYRGDPEQIETMLTEMLKSFRTFKKDLI